MSAKKPPPIDKGGTIKTIKTNSNVQILDLTYEENTNSSVHRYTEPQESDMDYSEATVIGNSEGHTANTPSQTISATKNPLPRFFNLNKDKYYNDNIYVYIEKTNDQNAGRLHPMYIGHILHKKLNIKNITTIEKVGFNRIKVGLKTALDANNLIKNELLEQEHLKAFIPNNLLVRKGVIKFVDTSFDEDYLMDNIETDHKILSVNRLKRKVLIENKISYVPRQVVILTFEGNKLPNEVYINRVVCPVEPYVQRVIQCFKCLRYGHVSSQCRSNKPLCVNCSKPLDENHKCDDSDTFCHFCKTNDHKSISKDCPHFEKQNKIKKHMSTSNMTFSEAKKFIDSSYSGVFTSTNRFELLNSLEDSDRNFPRLPNLDRNPVRSFTQPSRPSNCFTQTNKHLNKKRKVLSPSVQSPQIPPMFPFVMGSSQPLPSNANNKNNTEFDNEKIIDCFTKCIHGILSKVKSVEDLQQIDNQFLKGEFSSLLNKLQIHAQ